MKLVFGLAVALTLGACATGYNPRYTYYEIQVVNNSNAVLTGVTVRDNASGRSYDCDDIEPLRLCVNKVGKRRLHADQVEISWRAGDGNSQTQALDIPVPGYFSTGLALRVVFDFGPDGTLKPYFDQDSPVKF